MSKRKQSYTNSIYGNVSANPARTRKAIIEHMYLRVFTEIACARFKWIGLPDSIDERFLELTLFQKALSVFYWDTTFDRYMALQASGAGRVNMYGNPTSFTVIGNTMVNKVLSGTDCIPIWGNFLRQPDWDIAMTFATKMAEVERTIEIDLAAMRQPFMLICDDNEKQSILQAYRMVTEGQPVIVGTNTMGDMLDSKFKLLDMGMDKEVVLNLQIAKGKIWNECMTFLGINNANQEKRERLVTSEVSANNSQVLMARNVALNSRRDAAERINKKYDLSVSVEWNMDIDNITEEKTAAETPRET